MLNTRLFIANAALAGVYTVVAYSSLVLFATLNASASPVWPPTGLAIAALLLWGTRLWPGIYVGAFAANFLRTSLTAASLAATAVTATSLAVAAGNTLEASVGAFLILRFAGGLNAFDRPRNLAVFVLAAGLAAPIISATVGVTSLVVGGLAQLSSYEAVWTTWWLGDAAGALIIAPLMISFLHHQEPAPKGDLRELVLLTLTTLLVGEFVFAPVIFSTLPIIRLGFAVIPIIVWAGLRFGSRGATGITFLFSTIAVWGTLVGLGPYGSGNSALLSLQFSMMVLATMGLAVGAVVRERLDAQAESRKARAAEKRFEVLVDSAPDAMVITDQEGRILQVNAQTENLFGYSRQELLSLKVEDLIPDRFKAVHTAHRADYQAAPRRRGMGIGMELYGLRRDGAEFPVEISLSPIQTETGLVVSSSIRDITERRRAQEERTRLAAIVESSSDAIVRETLEGTIVSWNKGAERMFGYTSQEAVGQKAGILMHTQDGESEFAEKLKREGRILPYETRLTRRDGVVIDVSLSVSPINDPTGRIVGASIVVQDITRRKNRDLSAKTRG